MRTIDVTVTAAAQGEALYLVATRAGLPVGHVLLRWSGSPHEPMASRLGNCPHIEDLFVRPDCRSNGIGSQLLATAEELARQQGHFRIGLGVAVGNHRARSPSAPSVSPCSRRLLVDIFADLH